MLRPFWNSERANIAPTFALTLVPLVLAVASAVDLSSISTKASKLQESLDATALAIGTEYYSGMSEGELYSLGQKFFLANNEYSHSEKLLYDSDAQPEYSAAASPTGEYDIISAASRVDHDPVFGGDIFWGANRRAFVKVTPGMPACILALNKHANDAVKIQGSTNVDLKKCVIASTPTLRIPFIGAGRRNSKQNVFPQSATLPAFQARAWNAGCRVKTSTPQGIRWPM